MTLGCADVDANLPTTFLHLPEDARTRIYRYSNLIKPCQIDMFREQGRSKSASTRSPCSYRTMARVFQPNYRNDYPWNHSEIPINILRVSHAVSEDASSALYSRNQFWLTLKEVDDFERFKQIPKPHLHLL